MKIVWLLTDIKMQYNSFEERINRKLANATMQPRGEVWDKIRHDLEKPPQNKGKKWGILGVCLLLCAVSLGLYIRNEPHAVSPITKREATHKPISKQEVAIAKKQNTATINGVASTAINKQSSMVKNNPVPVSPISEKKLVEQKVIANTQAIASNYQPLESHSNIAKENVTLLSNKVALSHTIANNQVEPTTIPSTIPPFTQSTNNISNLSSKKNIQTIDKQTFTFNAISKKSNPISPMMNDMPKPKCGGKWTWSLSTGNYAILYQPFSTHKTDSKLSRLQQSLGVANIGIGDSTSNLVIYNDQSLLLATETASKVSDTSLLKITVSPNTQFVNLSGEYRHSHLVGIEGGLAFYYQKMNRILIPVSDINSFGEAIASSKTTPYFGNEKSAIPFSFYVLEPRIMANLHFGAKRSDLGLGLGLAYRALVGATYNSASLRIAQIASKDSEVYNPHNFSIQGRVKYTYHINQKVGLFSAINSQVLLSRMYSNGISYKSPYMLGAEMGVCF